MNLFLLIIISIVGSITPSKAGRLGFMWRCFEEASQARFMSSHPRQIPYSSEKWKWDGRRHMFYKGKSLDELGSQKALSPAKSTEKVVSYSLQVSETQSQALKKK